MKPPLRIRALSMWQTRPGLLSGLLGGAGARFDAARPALSSDKIRHWYKPRKRDNSTGDGRRNSARENRFGKVDPGPDLMGLILLNRVRKRSSHLKSADYAD